jgi:hypothetical protein
MEITLHIKKVVACMIQLNVIYPYVLIYMSFSKRPHPYRPHPYRPHPVDGFIATIIDASYAPVPRDLILESWTLYSLQVSFVACRISVHFISFISLIPLPTNSRMEHTSI